MSLIISSTYDDRDVPAVAAADLATAYALWCDRQQGGPRLASRDGETTLMSVDETIMDMHQNPADGLALLRRLNCLVDILASRRFAGASVRERTSLIAAAAKVRFNARFGMSPVRMAWAMAPACDGEVSEAA